MESQFSVLQGIDDIDTEDGGKIGQAMEGAENMDTNALEDVEGQKKKEIASLVEETIEGQMEHEVNKQPNEGRRDSPSSLVKWSKQSQHQHRLITG